MNLMTKMLLLIIILLVPVVGMFLYASERSISVVEEQINIANQGRLANFMNEVESTLEQVARYANVITKDPDFAELAGYAPEMSRYDYAAQLESLERRLALFTLSSDRLTRITLYFPKTKQAASSNSSGNYDEEKLKLQLNTSWALREVTDGGARKRAFTRHFIEPYATVADPQQASIIVEVDLFEENIVGLLDAFKSKGNNDPFLVGSPSEVIYNTTSDRGMVQAIMTRYDPGRNGGKPAPEMMNIGGRQYLVYALTSPELRWTLVDYVPLQDILSPVNRSKIWFYAVVGILLLTGAAVAYLIYFQVQLPIRMLTESVLKLKKGRYSTRIPKRQNREFQQLIEQFNEMAAQTEYLIEQVYKEEIRAKEAVMKQLQSQINPHFLYNSFAFIVSMAKMNRTEPIVSFAHRLADYFRYTTRNEEMTTTLQEEIDFIVSYLDIMNHQLGQLQCVISVPESMRSLTVPRLLIQPIVENAVLHGIEPKGEGGVIRIAGAELADRWEIAVEDDGAGMGDDETALLRQRLALNDVGDSLGLRNVLQRMRHHFGKDACLLIEPSALGGVKICLQWPQTRSEGGTMHVLGSDR